MGARFSTSIRHESPHPNLAQRGGWRTGRACPLCPGSSDINLFRYCQGVIDLDAEVSHRAFDLGMPKQKLNGPEISCSPVDQGSFYAPQRMGPKQPRVQSGASDPLRNKASILAGRHSGLGTTTTREQELAGSFVGGLEVIIDGLAGLLAQIQI